MRLFEDAGWAPLGMALGALALLLLGAITFRSSRRALRGQFIPGGRIKERFLVIFQG